MKASSLKVKQAEKLASQLCKALFSSRCFMCRRHVPEGHAHHLVPRRFWHSRFCISNLVWLDPWCHGRVHDTPEGKAELESAIQTRFPAWWALIEDMKRIKPRPFRESDLKDAVRALRETA